MAPVIPILVETIIASLGLMGVDAAIDAAKQAAAAGKGPADIAAAAAAAAPAGTTIKPADVKRAAAEGQRVHTQSRIHTEVAEGQAAKAAAAEAAASKRWFGRGGRVGRIAGAGFTGLFALSMLPMIMEMFKGGGEERGAMPGGGAAGEQDLLALLGAMQGGGMGEGSDFDLRELYQRSGAATDMATRRQMMSSLPSSLGNRRADLDEIIRGNRDMLGQIAYSEPISIAQAYARQGLYGGPQQPQVNFQDLM